MRFGAELDVLRLRDFRLVFGAGLVSLLGDGVAPVALAFAVLDLTGSPTDLGIVLAARTAALVGSLLIGGVLADRIGRRAVMINADLVRLLAQGALGVLLVSGHATVAEIAVSQVLVGAATGFFNPASTGLMPAVAGDRLQQANALRAISMAVGNIGGPAIAGVLVLATGPGYAILIDAASYGMSALLLARVRRDVPAPAASSMRFLADLRNGFVEVRSRTWVWTVIVAASLGNLFLVAFPVLGALVAKRQLGGAGAWGAILAAEGVGALIGGTALLRFSPRRPLFAASVAVSAVAGPTLLLAVPAPAVLIAGAALLAGIGAMLFNTLWETTLQRHIPASALSRVSSYDWFGSLAIQPLGFALIGPLASGLGVSGTLYLCGAVQLGTVVALLCVNDVRRLPPVPDRVQATPRPGVLAE